MSSLVYEAAHGFEAMSRNLNGEGGRAGDVGVRINNRNSDRERTGRRRCAGERSVSREIQTRWQRSGFAPGIGRITAGCGEPKTVTEIDGAHSYRSGRDGKRPRKDLNAAVLA